MSTSLIQTRPDLPDFLRALAPTGTFSNSAFMGGISIGSSHPRLSIKGSKFAIIDTNGDRQALNTLALDVVLVGANPAVTKAFYLTAFDPNAGEFKAPDCFSDNGVTPSDRSTAKQAAQCAICPHNAWGSGNGGKGKACQDNKRLAVMLANSEDDRIFELRIPPTSLKSLGGTISELEKRGVPVPSVVMQLSFADVQHPELNFSPIGWVSDAQAPAIIAAVDSDRMKEVIGLTDVQGTVALPQPAPAPQAVQPQVPQFPQPMQQAPQPVQMPQPQVMPVPQFQVPLAAEPAAKTRKPRTPRPGPSFLDADAAPAPVVGATPVGYQPTPPMGQPSAEAAPAFPVQPQMVMPQPVPQGFAPVSNTDAMGVPGSTSADLDNMLNGIL